MPSFFVAVRCFLAVLLAVSLPLAARAEIVTLKLPQDYADFGLHPQSGDLAAVLAEKGEVHLFRAADLAAKQLEPYAKVRVGSTPTAICFKRFGDLELFAVVCAQDTQMYLINAKDGTLQRKVELTGADFSSVFSSINPEDPYVYYCHDHGHDCAMGVVNLRSMKSHEVMGDAQEGNISATGRIAYRRGPFSPSGFDSMRLVSEFTDEKPDFASMVDEHRDGGPYLPDPFEHYTASGTDLYNQTLDKRVAKLGILPLCFFKTKPLIIGLNEENHRRGSEVLQLRAVSYNAFGKIGKPIELKGALEHGGRKDGFGGDADAELQRGGGYISRKRWRLFADDAGERVVFAYRTRLDSVPLKDFEITPEPMMLATLDNSGVAAIDSDWKAEVKLFDPAVSMEFGKLPEGMKAEGKTLTWRPIPEQVGEHKIDVKLKHNFLERTVTFDVTVGFTATKLPFVPGEFVLSPDGTKALLLSGNPVRQQRFRRNEEEEVSPSRLALIETATGKVLAERKLAEPMRLSVLDAQHAVLLRLGDSGCEVLKLSNLEREKSFTTASRIISARIVGTMLVLQTERGGEFYQLGTFKKVRTIEVSDDNPQRRQERSPLGFLRNAVAMDGIVYDAELKPQLVFALPEIPSIQGAKLGWEPSANRLDDQDGDDIDRHDFHRGDREELRIDRTNARGLSIEAILRGILTQGRPNFELSVRVRGQTEGQILSRGQIDPRRDNPQSFFPQLRVTDDLAVVVQGRNLWRWKIPSAVSAAGPGEKSPLQFELRQTAFVLSGNGTTTLKHQSRGGKAPLKFDVRSPYEGLKIDEATGVVTIDEKPLLAEAEKALIKSITEEQKSGSNTTYADQLRAKAPAMIAKAEKVLGRRPAGIPAAIPLVIEVTDADFQQSLLQYYVLVEVPSAPVFERLKQLDATREAPPREPANNAAGQGAGDLQALQRRIEALEQRLDLNTRQLNQALKLLEQR